MSEQNYFAVLLHERRWSVVAALCLLLAAIMLWRRQLDATFVIATLGALAWFLDIRNRLRLPHIEPAAGRHETDDGTHDKNIDDREDK
ncbi:MAG: hypothetical protein H0T45_19340 [Pyrinomonadaceae bacterium]|nr:hypothetical protein [Pyrinomonadaceae bacterium]